MNDEVSRAEWLAVAALFALMFAYRLLAAWHYRIDSDETQHMHVVWGWTHGLLQYRDVFDNHAPLFQIVMAPLMWLLPERPETLLWLRVAMIPFFAAALWITYRLGRALFSPRVGVWAAVFTGFMPGFFLCTAEFRTDNLWTVLWLLGLLILVEGRLTTRRGFLAGLVFGATMAASLKTSLLLCCLGGAAAVTGLYGLLAGTRLSLKQSSRTLLAALGGFFLLPLLVLGYFAARHSVDAMYYGVLKHNLIMKHSATGGERWLLPGCALLSIPGGLYFLFSPRAIRGRRTIIFLTAAFYIVALFTIWPLLEREHYLPFFPLAVLLLTSPILWLTGWLGFVFPRRLPGLLKPAVLFPLVLALYEARVTQQVGRLRHDHVASDLSFVKSVLELTTPSQTVIDLKGETVFRPRASFYVFEPISRIGIRLGVIRDESIPEAVRTGTRIAALDSKNFPEKTRAFLNENYLKVGLLRVLGKPLESAGAAAPVKFQIQVPEKYAIVTLADGTPVAGGELDGTPYAGPRALAPGGHLYQPAGPAANLAVILADAVALGYKPVPPRAVNEDSPPGEKEERRPSKFERGFSKLIQ